MRNLTRRSLLLASAAALVSSPAAAALFRGGASTSGGASPSGTYISAPSGSITDWQGNVWTFGAAYTPTSGYSGGYYINKNGVVQNGTTPNATASWALGASTIPVPTGLTLSAGQSIIDGSLTDVNGTITPTLIGYVGSYNSSTGVITLQSGALAASSGSTDALGIGQNTWTTAMLYLNDVVYSVDLTDQWTAYSDAFSPTQQWNAVSADPRNFSTAISPSGTVNSTALAPTSIPSDPAWPVS